MVVGGLPDLSPLERDQGLPIAQGDVGNAAIVPMQEVAGEDSGHIPAVNGFGSILGRVARLSKHYIEH